MTAATPATARIEVPQMEKILIPEDEWRGRLTPDQFRITREAGTERAFSGEYWNAKTRGIYHCVCCGLALFPSDTKYESGTGWPSFWRPVDEAHIETRTDASHGMTRTEVACARCDAHLGHLFEDGPPPTGLRYCLNSASLQLIEAEDE